MHRRSFVKTAAIGFAALPLGRQQLLAQTFADPWRIKMLTDSIGVFTEKGGTILFYLAPDSTLVIDTEFPEQAGHLITELGKRSTKPFGLLINTHHHADHTSGNINFKGQVGTVLAHENSLKNQTNVAKANKSEDKQVYPNKTFRNKWSENFGREKVTLHYFGPAHTDGDSLIHLEHANIVHMGDLINNRRYPYIDRAAGASISNWITVLEKATKTFDGSTTYVFGHASEGFEVFGKQDDVLLMKDYFEKLMTFTHAAVKSRVPKEEFVRNTAIPGVTQWIGDGIERSLTAAYEEVSGPI